jgi:hypothetical protein
MSKQVEVGQVWVDRLGGIARITGIVQEGWGVVYGAVLLPDEKRLVSYARSDLVSLAEVVNGEPVQGEVVFSDNGDEIEARLKADADEDYVDLNLILPVELIERIKLTAEAKGISTDELINDTLKDYLAHRHDGTFVVFSINTKTYDDERDARAAAMKFAQTGGVWHVAKVLGSAVPQEPEWQEVV